MVARNPCYNTTANTNIETVDNRVKVLEKLIADFMKHNSEHMIKVNQDLDSIRTTMTKPGPTATSSATTRVEKGNIPRTSSVSKRQRVDENVDMTDDDAFEEPAQPIPEKNF